MILVAIKKTPIVRIHFDLGILEISARLFDEDGNLLAEIDRNHWVAHTDHI